MPAAAAVQTPAEKVQFYIRLRDHKKASDEEYKKSMERVNAAMDKLEAELLQILIDTGADSLACPNGTVYRNTQVSATVEDREAFLNYVMQNGEFEALDVKANKSFVRNMAEQNGEVPPGVKYTSMHTVGVRRA